MSHLEAKILAARCLIIHSNLKTIYSTRVRPQLREVMWSTTVILKGTASLVFLLKENI